MSLVAVAQMRSSSQVSENLAKAKQLITIAHEAQAKLIVLPENFAFMGLKETDKQSVAEVFGQGPIQDKMSQWSRQFSIWIIAGTIPIKGAGSKIRASSLVYDDKGVCAARYDKIHLFDVRVSKHEAHQESLSVEPGENVIVVDTPVGKIGLTVCYDLRFPELYHQLMYKGAELFSIPSAFTSVTGLAHWDILVKARAIENLCYVLAPNQCGKHENGRQTYGHSLIIDPWGKTLAEQNDGIGIIRSDINLDEVKQLRKQFPCNEHHVLMDSLQR